MCIPEEAINVFRVIAGSPSIMGKKQGTGAKPEDRVEVNEEGTITSIRKRDGTNVGQFGCDWSVRVS